MAAAGSGPRARFSLSNNHLLWSLVILAVFAALISACGKRDSGLGPRVIPLGQPVPKGGGVYKLGKPYSINGRKYAPREDPSYDQVGIASWYGELFHGRYTANGEIYDMAALSAAHPTLPLPTYARVTNLANGRSIVVRVNDRGPYAHNRIIDLSQRSAQLLGFHNRGTAPVRVTYVGKASLNGDDSYERRVLAGQPWLRYASAETQRLAGVSPRQMAASTRVAKTSKIAGATRNPGVPQTRLSQSRFGDPMTVGSLPEPKPKPEAKSVAPAEQSASPLERPVFVQAGSFRNQDNAERLRQKLAQFAPVEVLPVSNSTATFYRVRLGPFTRQDRTDEALRRAEAAGAIGARITSN